MSFTLYVATDRWRAHQAAVLSTRPGLVPVAKGNGYGFGNRRLAAEAALLGADTLAVGLAHEIGDVADAFAGDIVVLTPFLVGEDSSPAGEGPGGTALPDRVIRTVASVDAVRALAGGRVIVDCRTSLHRHGVTEDDLAKLRPALDDVRVEGFAVHLPLDRPTGVDPAAEVEEWVARLDKAGMPLTTLFVSHLTASELERLSERHPGVGFRPRIGTALWLGDRRAWAWRGTVQDVTPIRRGERYGYRQRRALADGHLVVVSGGTSHGVGLEAPKAVRGVAPRAKNAARAGLAAANRALSPFTWAGKQRWFAEPPHMQASLLLLPANVPPPAVGDELDAELRSTTTYFDRIADR